MKKLLVVLIFAVGLFIFFKPILVEGKIYSLGGVVKGDFLPFHYPIREFYRQSLLAGRFPFWISTVGNGYPLLAEGEIGAFYPPNLLLFLLLPTNTAIGWLLFLHLLLAAVGMYVLIYKLTNSRFSSVISGFSFSLSGYMVTQLTEVSIILTYSWLPLIFLLYLKLRDKFTFRRFVGLSLVFAMQILAGSLTLFYYQMVVLFIYGIFRFKSILVLVLALILSAGLCAIQLVLSLELASLSVNEKIPIEDQQLFVFPKEGFMSFLGFRPSINPESGIHTSGGSQTPIIKNPYNYYAYFGILPIIALPFGIFVAFKKKNISILILLALVFLTTLGVYIPVFKFFYSVIPGMGYFRHSIRFLAFVEFFLLIIAAYGLNFLENRLRKKTGFLIWIFALVVFFDLYKHQSWVNPVDRPYFWLSQPEIISQIKALDNNRVSEYSLGRISFDIYSNSNIQKELVNLSPANFSSVFNISTNRIFSPLIISYTYPFLSSDPVTNDQEIEIYDQQQKGKIATAVPLGEDLIKMYQDQAVKYIVSPYLLDNSSLTLKWQKSFSETIFNELLGRVIDEEGKTSEVFTWKVKIDNVYLYELKNNLPRARIDGGGGKAEIVRDSGNSLEINAQADKPSSLYVADTYYPGWKAYVDGVETKIHKANYAFRSIQLPEGSHQVVFKYQPMSFKIGKIISLISITIVIILFRFKHETKTGF